MRFFREGVCILAVLVVAMSSVAKAVDVSQAEWEQMKKDIQDLRNSKKETARPIESQVDCAVDNKYGPNAVVTTKQGKLTVSGLLQVWYYSFQQDRHGLFNDPNINSISDTNQGQDNSSFRIRRAEIKLTMDINENVTSVVMIDPAREATSFPNLMDNQGAFKRTSNIASEFAITKPLGTKSTGQIVGIQTGVGAAPRLLQDAYINYHGVVPHHDFQIGQYKPFLGEEGIRSSGQLDFVERSMIGNTADARDAGFTIHGSWWDDAKDGRFQYWMGAFNGAGNYYASAGQYQNRSDDNNSKDANFRVLVRPLWGKDCDEWQGKLELGASTEFGEHGEGGHVNPITDPTNGLNHRVTWASRNYLWMSYMAGGAVSGLWVRGEYGTIYDRNAPLQVIDLTGSGDSGTAAAPSFFQSNGKPFGSSGYYGAIGYKLADSRWAKDNCDSMPSWLKPFEFAGRYDSMQNVQVVDVARNDHTNVYKTDIWTAGINYYLKGHNAKLQANYSWVNDPTRKSDASQSFHNVRNDVFALNFQVAF